ncbi:MAG: M24 family metallopeptidase [Acidimicrobiales bacterium]
MGTTKNAPTLSLAERDRRWSAIRSLLDERGLAAAIIPGLRARESFETWVSGEAIQGAVVFPASGDPVYLTWIAFRVIGREDPGNDREYWIKDIRAGLIGPALASTLKEMGITNERVGIVGLRSTGPMELEGFIPFTLWQRVIDDLPNVTFEEISVPFSYLMAQKSEEELVLARHCASVGEQACERMLEVVRPGVSEEEVYAEVTGAIYRAGLSLTPPSFILKSGRDSLSWGPPEWGVGAVPPRVIGKGELVSSELMPTYGGIETQQQMMIATGPVEPLWRELDDVVRRSYDAGLEVCKPGTTFVELCDAMAVPLKEAGCWHLSPLVHSTSPAYLLGTLHGGVEEVFAKEYPWLRTIPPMTDAVLAPGMLFAFEPNACRGRTRVNIGGAVLVGASGPEELNTLPRKMHTVE